ncbi:hypothetical protein P7C71_g5354, partial [Lecanoromycetidae sp. Uapishka_2]
MRYIVAQDTLKEDYWEGLQDRVRIVQDDIIKDEKELAEEAEHSSTRRGSNAEHQGQIEDSDNGGDVPNERGARSDDESSSDVSSDLQPVTDNGKRKAQSTSPDGLAALYHFDDVIRDEACLKRLSLQTITII